MFFVGDVDPAGQELVRVTYECWQEAINFCKPGRAYKDIGAIIEQQRRQMKQTVEQDKLAVASGLAGLS